MRVRKHSPWLPAFDHGVLVLVQSGVMHTFWFQNSWTRVKREKFYQRVLNPGVKPFRINTMATPFLVLTVGIVLGVVGFLREMLKVTKHHF